MPQHMDIDVGDTSNLTSPLHNAQERCAIVGIGQAILRQKERRLSLAREAF